MNACFVAIPIIQQKRHSGSATQAVSHAHHDRTQRIHDHVIRERKNDKAQASSHCGERDADSAIQLFVIRGNEKHRNQARQTPKRHNQASIKMSHVWLVNNVRLVDAKRRARAAHIYKHYQKRAQRNYIFILSLHPTHSTTLSPGPTFDLLRLFFRFPRGQISISPFCTSFPLVKFNINCYNARFVRKEAQM